MTDAQRILRGTGRWLAYGQLALVVAIAIGLLLAESTRPTFLLVYAPRWPILITGLVACGLAVWLRSRWLVGAQIATLLVAAFPVCGLRLSLPARPSHDARATLRVRTWNIYFGKLGYEAVARSLAESSADVKIVQASRDHVSEACQRLGFTLREDGDFAIASRYPVRAVDVPPPFADGKPRMYVRYEVETPGGRLALVAVHPYSPRHAIEDGGGAALAADAELRERQIAAAVESGRASGIPFVIVGDTNLPPGSAIARRRFAGLRDAFDDVGNGFGFTFPAKRPWMRIDRFLAGDGVRFLSITTGPLGASDHRAVEAELEIVGGGR